MSLLLAFLLLAAGDDLCSRLASEDSNDVIAACNDSGANEEPAVTTALIRLLKHDNPAVRKAAIKALGVRKPKDEAKRGAQALAQRIAPLAEKAEKGDEGKAEREECVAICEALHDLAQPVALKELLDGITLESNAELARQRVHAAANIPSKEAVEELLQLGSAGHRGNWRTSMIVAALQYATQEKVQGGMEAWRRWWNENKDTYDAEMAAIKRAEARVAEPKREKRRKGKGGGSGGEGG